MLPLKCKHFIAFFHQTNLCTFCKKNDELVSHVFYRCSELRDVWDYVDICLFKLTGVNVSLSIALCLYLDVRTAFKQISTDQETAIVLLLSVTKYSIWIHTNNMVYDNAIVNISSTTIDIKNRYRNRHLAEKTRSNKNYECAIRNLFRCL